jgi:hypothetical protein
MTMTTTATNKTTGAVDLEERIDRLAKGWTTMTIMGRDVPMRLSPRARARFEESRKRGYLVARGNRKDRALRNLWEWWCDHAPYADVRVEPRRQYAHVSMDLIQTPVELTNAEQHMVVAMLKRYDRSISAGRVYIYAAKAPVDQAEQMARYLVDVYRAHKKSGVRNAPELQG